MGINTSRLLIVSNDAHFATTKAPVREDVQEDAEEIVAGPTMLEEMRRMEAARHHSVPSKRPTNQMQ